MIQTIITLGLQAALPIITWFFKRSQKNQDVKERMYALIDEQCKGIMKNNNLRRQYDRLRAESQKKD